MQEGVCRGNAARQLRGDLQAGELGESIGGSKTANGTLGPTAGDKGAEGRSRAADDDDIVAFGGTSKTEGLGIDLDGAWVAAGDAEFISHVEIPLVRSEGGGEGGQWACQASQGHSHW